MRKFVVSYFIGLAVCGFSFAFLVYPPAVAAQTDVKDQAKNYLNLGAEEAGLKVKDKPATNFRVFLAEFVKFFMVAYGMIFVILMVVAGYWMLTARGDEEQVKKGINTIQGAVIGLFIILSAWGISTLVARKAIQATNFGPDLESQ